MTGEETLVDIQATLAWMRICLGEEAATLARIEALLRGVAPAALPTAVAPEPLSREERRRRLLEALR